MSHTVAYAQSSKGSSNAIAVGEILRTEIVRFASLPDNEIEGFEANFLSELGASLPCTDCLRRWQGP